MACVLQEAPETALRSLLEGGALGVRIVAKETVESLVSNPMSWQKPEFRAAYLCYDQDAPERSGRWVAVDNRDGDAYTEEFKDPAIAIAWLRGDLEADEAHAKDGTAA